MSIKETKISFALILSCFLVCLPHKGQALTCISSGIEKEYNYASVVLEAKIKTYIHPTKTTNASLRLIPIRIWKRLNKLSLEKVGYDHWPDAPKIKKGETYVLFLQEKNGVLLLGSCSRAESILNISSELKEFLARKESQNVN